MKKRQRACFLSPRSSKIIITKEKESKKERARRKKGGQEKKAMVALLVFIIATTEIAITLPKIRLDILVDQSCKVLRVKT